MPANIDISDIQNTNYPDGEERHLLDSADKIIRWIKHQFSIQEKNNTDNPERAFPLFINLSNCIICTVIHDNNPSMTNICELAGRIDCIIDTASNYHSQTSKFHTEVLEEIRCLNSIIYAPFFDDTKFHKVVRIEHTQFIGDCHLSGSYFGKSVFIQHCEMKSIHSDGAKFNSDLYLGNINFSALQISFRHCEFNKEVKIGQIKFNEREHEEQINNEQAWMSFYGSNFHSDIKLSDSSFQRVLDLSKCSFEGDVIFRKVTSTNLITFYGSMFKRQLLLSSNSIEEQITIKELCFNNIIAGGRIDIESCVINSFTAHFMEVDAKGIFRICNCKICKSDMDSFCNNGYVFFDNNVKGIVEISFNSAINNGIIELENTEIRNLSSRKTARLLKDSAYKSNNSIDAVYYKSQEMKFYWKELSSQVFSKKVLYSLQDLILLIFNTISNYYGRWWVLGFVFTITVAFLFYTLFSFSLGIIDWSTDVKNWMIFDTSYWKRVFQFLWLPDVDGFKELSKNPNSSIGSYIWYILGKILIGYGIYQTISAFRKYGK